MDKYSMNSFRYETAMDIFLCKYQHNIVKVKQITIWIFQMITVGKLHVKDDNAKSLKQLRSSVQFNINSHLCKTFPERISMETKYTTHVCTTRLRKMKMCLFYFFFTKFANL